MGPGLAHSLGSTTLHIRAGDSSESDLPAEDQILVNTKELLLGLGFWFDVPALYYVHKHRHL